MRRVGQPEEVAGELLLPFHLTDNNDSCTEECDSADFSTPSGLIIFTLALRAGKSH